MFVGEPINIMTMCQCSVPLSITISFVWRHYFCIKCWFVASVLQTLGAVYSTPSALPTLSVTGNCAECFVLSVALAKVCTECFLLVPSFPGTRYTHTSW
jgi:hypothetical protein